MNIILVASLSTYSCFIGKITSYFICREYRVISDKSLSDSVEAIIGTFLYNSGQKNTLQVIVCALVCVCVCVSVFVCVCMSVCVCVYTLMWVQVNVCVCANVCY